jgi:O-acetyl-ADP-ribose deacetylase (regulator of RNase III)
MSVSIVEGNILNSNAQYIIHQTNCVSFGFSGLANSIFEKYPESNIYKIRSELNTWHKPGHIYIVEKVINAMGQFFPGTPHSEVVDGILINDTKEQRIEWFKMCLARILKLPNLQSIDFPWKIGCGLAGGNWDEYKKIINSFSKKTSATIQIIKRNEDD